MVRMYVVVWLHGYIIDRSDPMSEEGCDSYCKSKSRRFGRHIICEIRNADGKRLRVWRP